MTRIAPNSRRSRTSCSLIALATVLAVGASPVAAQSFQGSGVFNSGSGTITTGAGATNIALTTQNSVITWTPTDTAFSTSPITFQNSSTTATFSRAGNFAVLNKIIPADTGRAIAMHGNVHGRVNGVQGGSVYFYSPGGFIFGGTSVFNVGSLVVTALPVNEANFMALDSNGFGSVSFGPAANAGATISNSGTIDARNPPPLGIPGASPSASYVAMIAPRVTHNSGALITVNGSAALVAAEAATINFSADSLFDIQVTTGTTDTTGVSINGDIGGPTPTGPTDKQGIYVVAVPKNDALTMVIGAGTDLGFTLANTAVDDNGVIVLSAGHDIVDGAIGAKSAGHGAGSANLWFTGGHATNNLFVKATGSAYLYSAGGSHALTTFDNDVTVHGDIGAHVQSFGAGSILSVAGNLSLSSDRIGAAGQSVTAGTASVYAASTISITGTLDLSADGVGGDASTGSAGSGTGGFVGITVENGSTLTFGNLTASATGTGGNGLVAGVNAGFGTGGTVRMVSTGGINSLTSNLLFDAQGIGGSASGLGLAGNGWGGRAEIRVSDNTSLTLNGNVTLDADGLGGAHSSGTGGNGTGGTAQTDILTNAALTVNGDLGLSANGTGGAGGSGGIGDGGIANLGADFGSSSGATMTVNVNTTIFADGLGGNAVAGAGGYAVGGDAFMGGNTNTYNFNGDLTISASATGGWSQSGTGGNADGGVAALDSGGATIHVGDTVYVMTNALGGDGASGGSGIGGFSRIRSRNIDIDGSAYISANGGGGFGFSGNGGNGGGGNAQLRAEAGVVDIGGSVFANADGYGGGSQNSGSSSGNGDGGTVTVQALTNGTLNVTDFVLASASGFGGGVFAFGTNGGNGTGGFAYLQAFGANATVTLGSSASIAANGVAGELCGECGGGGIGGGGFGGQVTVQAFGSNTADLSITGNLTAEANGEGGDAVTGNGGIGDAGSVYLGANDGANLHLIGTLIASAEGEGGYSFGPGNGGPGIGGDVSVNATGGGTLAIDGDSILDADGYGGGAGISASGDGGDGIGGFAGVYANGGSIDIGGDVTASADGEGGNSDNGTGGDGFGTFAEIFADQSGSIDIGGNATLSAIGAGGDGLTGGDGFGGGDADTFADGVHVSARRASIAIAGNVSMDVSGTGGNGGDSILTSGIGGAGGDGTGGWTTVVATNDDLGGSSIVIGDLTISANGTGGAGGMGGSGNLGGAGGDGGDGTGGNIGVFAHAGNGALTAGDVIASATATGGAGGAGGNGDNEAGGDGGNGGDAEGGYIGIGTASGPDRATASNLGIATYASISANASATGGDGGNGNFGSPNGVGGDGGTAESGGVVLLVRGSTVNVGNVNMTANATGGDGGFGGGEGPRNGNGGNASVGGISDFDVGENTLGVVVTERFLHPTHLGTLDAGAITGSAIALGGLGATPGSSQTRGGNDVFVRRASATMDSLDFNIVADSIATGALDDSIFVSNGTALVNGDFSFQTDGTLVLFAENGSMTSNIMTLSASNFVPGGLTTLNPGTFFANAFNITTGLDFYTLAKLDSASSLSIHAPGEITAYTIDTDTFVDLEADGGDIIVDALNIGTDASLDATGSIDTDDIGAGGNVGMLAGGSIGIGNIVAGGDVSLVAGTFIDGEDINAGGGIYAQTLAGNIDLENLTANGDVILDASGAITLDTVQAGFFRADAGGTFDSNDITSDADIRIGAGDDVTLGDLDAGLPAGGSSKAVRIDTDGSVLAGNIVALGGIDVTANGSVTGLNVTTGDVLITEANGAISYDNISAGLVNPQPGTEPVSVALDSATSINVDNVNAAGTVGFITSGTLTAGNVTTGSDLLGLVHGNMTIDDISAGGRVLLADSSMFTSAGGVIGNFGDDDIDIESIFAATPVATNGSITVGNVTAGSFQAAPGTFFSSGDITTDGLLYIDAGTNVTGNDFVAGDIFSPAAVSITAGNNIQLGDVTSGGGIGLGAVGSITTDDLFAYGSIFVDAGGAVSLGDVTTQFPLLELFALGEGITIQSHSLGPSVEIYSDTSVSTDNIASAEDVIIESGGLIDTGNITAAGWINLIADTDITTLDLTTDLDVNLDAGDDIAFGDASVGTEFDFDAGGDVTSTGNMTAGNQISGEAGGLINLGDLTVTGGLAEGEDFSVGMTANGNITVLNVSATNPVGFGTHGNLATGNVSAGGLFMALVGGNTTTGSITTTGEGGGQVYIADDSMFEIGEVGEDDFNPNLVLALDPVATGGSITINGPVTTGLFRASAGTDLTTQVITAGEIHASAGGTATINGLWSTEESVQLSSNDIAITATGGIDAGFFLTLISTNGTQALIGDGVSGPGYALSNAEFGRISGYEVEILARGDASAAIDMLIGDLTVTGPLAGSTVEGSDLVFATGSLGEEPTASGVIRVVGDINATGFAADADQSIDFHTGRFELDAATGSISIVSSGTTLGGEIGLYADRIHVAEGEILNQLAANPTYTGYQQDLNEPANVERPEGVLRADTLWIESDNLQDILIQNTGGNSSPPAGFLVRQAFVNDDDEVAGPPGSINLVVNGQVVTEGGTQTGVAARDALIDAETDITPFTSTSTINGCPLTGACIIPPPEPPPEASLVDSQIDLIGSDPLGDSEFGNEEEIGDNEEGGGEASNPISPPQPLFDTRPLIPASDVNDPVSGTGNPALLDGKECEEDEDTQCGTEQGGGE